MYVFMYSDTPKWMMPSYQFAEHEHGARTVDGEILKFVVFFERGRGLLRIFGIRGGVGIGNDGLGGFARTTAGRRRHDFMVLRGG